MELDDWDLQAVVRGCTGPTTTSASADHFYSFSPASLLLHEERAGEDDILFCYPDLFATQTPLHELEELCNPFLPKSSQQHQQQQKLALSPQSSTSAFSGGSLLATGGGGEVALPLPEQQIRQPQQRPISQTPRSKRRKNQQKRVVCQVPADGLSSDMWAWRKYGQKPIKGSPYPRGYYRCSSSKGCLARKQVERSRTDPGMFVITYTAEHNHPLPTHRNSLAGSTRHKFPTSSSSSSSANANQTINAPGGAAASGGGGGEVEHPSNKPGTTSPLSSPTAAGLSPVTPLMAYMEDELLLPRRRGGKKKEAGEEEVAVEEEEAEEDLLLVGDIEMLGEDDVLFMDLEELREPTSAAAATTTFADGFSDHFGVFPPPWMANNAATSSGGS